MTAHPLTGGAWRRSAACLGANPELFYDRESYEDAKSICAGCPVLDACLEDAILKGDYHGVRAGLTGDDRRSLVRLARRASA